MGVPLSIAIMNFRISMRHRKSSSWTSHPFGSLNAATMGMTAHLVYDVWDSERCATMSPTIIEDIIRGEIGFDGLLMSDDLEMKALKGDVPTHAVDCIAAGCDVALELLGSI